VEVVVAGLGLNAAVVPAGRPLTLRLTGEANPFFGATVTVEVAREPCTALAAVALSAKSEICSHTAVERVRPPPLPVIATVSMTGPTEVRVARAKADVYGLCPVPGVGERVAGSRVGVAEGVVTVSDIGPLNPFFATAETLAVACPFCTVMLDDGVRETGADMRVADVSTLLAESLE